MILIMIIIIFSNDKYARNSGKCTHPRLCVAYICIGGRMRKLMMGGMGVSYVKSLCQHSLSLFLVVANDRVVPKNRGRIG